MITVTRNNYQIVKEPNKMIFVHTPFCGTCHLARRILSGIEEQANKNIFYEINAGLFPEMMQEKKVESVPCLMITKEGDPEKVYSFDSIAKLYQMMYENG